jgi:hypothetical protein
VSRCSKKSSLEDLVVARKYYGGHFDAEGLGGRQIDDEVEAGRLFDWDIARLRPVQNLINHLGGAPEQGRVAWSVGNETPGFDKNARSEERKTDSQSRRGLDRVTAETLGAEFSKTIGYADQSEDERRAVPIEPADLILKGGAQRRLEGWRLARSRLRPVHDVDMIRTSKSLH